MKKIIVQKFGGTSVATPQRIRNVAGIIRHTKKRGYAVVVVVSAPGDTTDDLINFASQVSSSIPDREMDMLLATGEQSSIALLSMALADIGEDAISFTGAQAGILTDGIFGRARILKIEPARILEELKKGRIVVVAGFQGVDKNGEITTLGRGGSDTTAVALGVALKAEIVDIYTDVRGVYTADPRIVPRARKVKTISYDEVLELASLGAKVLHPRAAEIAKIYGLKVRVRSSFVPEDSGTLIVEPCRKKIIFNTTGEDMEKSYVVSATSDKNQAKITVVGVPDRPGIASRIFTPIARAHINVDMIVQNVSHRGFTDMSFTVARGDLQKTINAVKAVVKKIGAENLIATTDIAKVSIVGAGMYSYPGVAARMFQALARKGINIEMISTSEIKISCVVKEKDADAAVRALHKEFHLDRK